MISYPIAKVNKKRGHTSIVYKRKLSFWANYESRGYADSEKQKISVSLRRLLELVM